jgi:hypothetical protein
MRTPGLELAGYDCLPAIVDLDMLVNDADRLLAARAHPVQCHRPALERALHASDGPGKPRPLHIGLLPSVSVVVLHVLNTAIELRGELHYRAMCRRELVNHHLFQAVLRVDRVSEIEPKLQ